MCGAPASARHANLVFDGAHQQHQDGQITAGGSLTIQYDVGRLPTCRNSQGGHPLWDLTAHVHFEPTNEMLAASVRDGAATFAVPTSGATRVAVWFENTSSTGCQAWDSNDGNNYVFALAHAPQWIGNAATRISRDTSDPCEGGVPAGQGFSFDTWSRQRAAFTNLCFDVYDPGLTDRDDPDLWKKLDASIVYRIVGESTWHTQAANVSSRHGNDARFATSWRPIDPFRMYNCPVVAPTPSVDPQYMQLSVEYYVVVNGAELRPAAGATFTGVFSDYLAPRCTP
ncbi:MAG: DUF6209 family protein [Proteobacteria bacterium]|nr:DUF6209 family protein [Pseudomonadota bacterium]